MANLNLKFATLILNDESHHIYNEPRSIKSRSIQGKNIKKWKQFLTNDSFNFNYILGFTGTAYIDDEYFTDVIFRYPLRQAIDDGVVKSINYVQEDDSSNDRYEKFQKIYKNHQTNISQNRNLKPLTILITKDINNAENLYEDLVDFLSEWEELTLEEVEKKILIVTSDSKHSANLIELEEVDDNNNKVEWIISVSMLTEGWDVKNVFQIVPWEDRAFNSKLLIAQVLGRGLRIPLNNSGKQPTVTVFNHDSWSKNIKTLVDEVLEIETRIISSVNYEGDRNKYNFTVHNLQYEKQDKIIDHKETKQYNYKRVWEEGIKLVSQTDNISKETIYEDLVNERTSTKKYNIEYRLQNVEDIVNNIINRFKTVDWESEIIGVEKNEVYSKANLPPKEKIREIIFKSMKNVGISGSHLTEDNVQRVYNTFSTLFRQKSKTLTPVNLYKEPIEIKTEDMNNESIGVSSFRSDATAYYCEDYKEVAINGEQVNIFKRFLDDGTLPKKSEEKVNRYLFKTPQNFVFTNKEPEYKFVEHLCSKENFDNYDAWIKSRDSNFYSLEYTYRIGNHQKQRKFNPDFFIKCTREGMIYYLVIEIKSDKDITEENKGKYKYGKLHFTELNKQLKDKDIREKYIFHFLSPKDYYVFFDYINNGKMFESTNIFKSELERLLEE